MEKIPEFFKNVVFFASRPNTPHRDEAIYLLTNFCKKREVRNLTLPLEGRNRAYYISIEDKKILDEYLLKILNSEKLIDEHLQEYLEIVAEANLFRNKVDDLKKSKKFLLSCFNDFNLLAGKIGVYAWIPIYIDAEYGEKFLDKLKKENADNADEIYRIVTSLSELYEYQKMRLKIFEIVLSGDKKRIKELVREYSWVTEYSLVEDLADYDYFEKEIDKISKENAKIEIEKMKRDIAQNAENFKKIKQDIKNSLLRKQAELINKYVFLRNDRVDLYRKIQVSLRKIFDAIGDIIKKEKGIYMNHKDLAYFLNREIEDYLVNGNLPDLKEIEKRKTSRYVYYHDKNGSFINTDEKFIEESIKIIVKKEEIKEIKGTIAFKGIVRGKVALILDKKDLHKVEKDSVLVARTTMPDYTHAMEIASAFVTDEGGLLSHAAIISRELKRPCIVGSKNATKILKDGMIVEVDANKGIVRIINEK